ncbi:MAG: hypothetical protein JRJ15_16310 [Deltaproteobacteria bacterium]|nr:hypothetical protein [Deltaproteobacteria bacterium]
MFNFELSEERRQFQQLAKKFAEKEVKPFNDKFEDDWYRHNCEKLLSWDSWD